MRRASQTLKSGLRDAIASADTGNFGEALRQAKNFDGLLPVGLFTVLKERDSRSALGLWLAEKCTGSAADRLFSTWDLSKGAEWADAASTDGRSLVVEGNGIVRTGVGMEFVTLGQQTATLRLAGLPSTGSYVVHMLASFHSNVGDNFYLQLDGPDGSETVRFSNTNVSLVNYGAVSKIFGKAIKLYTLQVTPEQARLYVNGVLYKSKLRTGPAGFTDLVIKLIGEPGPDLSGLVHGFEIQHTNGAIGSVFGDDKALFLERLHELLEQRDVSEIYILLKGIDDDWVQEVDDELLSLLDVQVSTRGVQEWIYDQILARVSPTRAAEWVADHRDQLPAPVLSVNKLTAEFMLSPNNRFALGSLLRRTGRERFLVLDDINFDVFPGDIVGIIGPNGAGKSTLLRAISGLMPIQKGEIVLRVEHLLLSAGIGARNELTGRENIYLAGTFMGLSKAQIDELFDEIWQFSELGPAIDKPFKYYSDGMKGRLVFSLATSVSPQILMLDELLSAGDIKFQKKAGDRMEQMLDRAKAVIVVTHSVQFVAQRCNKALLIAGGKLAAYGDPQEVLSHYLNLLHLGDVPEDTDINPLDMNIQQQVAGGFINGR
jgi:ABC-type polysaccharide/polyol phosphate transport system ATPase subunit